MLQGKKYMIAVKLPNKMDLSEIWMEQDSILQTESMG